MLPVVQTGFIGPAVLLHLLRPKMAASGTAVLLTASPGHRLAALDDLQDTLTTWGHTTLVATQVRACWCVFGKRQHSKVTVGGQFER